MQPPLSKLPQPEPENRSPDCLYMELAGVPVQPEKRLDKSPVPRKQATAKEQINLHLTIEFNEKWQPLPGGGVIFGLKGGELRLKLEGGKILSASRELRGSFELFTDKEKQEQESSENQSGLEAAYAASKAGIQTSIGTKKHKLTPTDNFQIAACQVTTKGSEENPAWVFEVDTGEPVLKGLLQNVKLGTLSLTNKPCRVEATFEVSLRDVYLSEASGSWLKGITPEKKAVLDRGLALLLLKRKLQPYLSRQDLRYV